MNRLLSVAGSLCVALGLTACGVQEGGGGERYLPAEQRVRSLTLPFDEYTLSPFQMRTLDYAEDLLVRECMRGHGMDWQVPHFLSLSHTPLYFLFLNFLCFSCIGRI